MMNGSTLLWAPAHHFAAFWGFFWLTPKVWFVCYAIVYIKFQAGGGPGPGSHPVILRANSPATPGTIQDTLPPALPVQRIPNPHVCSPHFTLNTSTHCQTEPTIATWTSNVKLGLYLFYTYVVKVLFCFLSFCFFTFVILHAFIHIFLKSNLTIHYIQYP